MFICVMKAKIHHAHVTQTALNYQGSLPLDKRLMEAAGFVPYEQIQVYNVDSGTRFETYVIPGSAGTVIVNGAAARLAQVGDRLIIVAFVYLPPEAAPAHQPRVIILDENNQITAG